MKTVWILGAGFSRSLGGPLLPQLLSAESEQDVATRFPDTGSLSSEAALIVRRVYLWGTRLPVRVHHWNRDFHARESLWDHAEDFLDYLDTAALAPDGPRAKLVLRLAERARRDVGFRTNATIEQLAAAGRRLIGAECCAFLSDADTTSEKWKPYRRWGLSLRGDDTVISFNYDRVLELLGAMCLDIAPPEWWAQASAARARVIKLHGSVDWRREEQNGAVRFSRATDPHFAISCDDRELAIATPGPTKFRRMQELHAHWTMATRALREADVIVFVGFRFPPTDAEARSILLEAIKENASDHLSANIVLGPERSPDVVRLEEMLRAVCVGHRREEPYRNGRMEEIPLPAPSFSIATHAMWAEDFFTVCSPVMIR